MWTSIQELDRILRGEATRPGDLTGGRLDVRVRGLVVVLVLLGFAYGVCMGSFALVNRPEPEFRQLGATVLKVPALFFLTLLVTFPSLYVFNALVGSRLTVISLLRLLIAALGVNLAVLASLGPIVAFFSLTTDSYPFMVLLNVLVFAVAGVLGLLFLLRTLHRLTQVPTVPIPDVPVQAEVVAPSDVPPPESAPFDSPPPSALDPLAGHVLGPHVKGVFRCWVIVFGLVGAQMAWILRPFIGSPDMPFAWFRPRDSNFFEAVWRAAIGLFR
jgi:hypothetical protein